MGGAWQCRRAMATRHSPADYSLSLRGLCRAADNQDEMNLLSAIAPTSVPVSPLSDVPTAAQAVVMKKALDTQRAQGAALVSLLDPNVGKHIDVQA